MPIQIHLLPPAHRLAAENEAATRERPARARTKLENDPQAFHEGRVRLFARLDAYPQAVRRLIHEYGASLVERFYVKEGVPAHLIEARILELRKERDRAYLIQDLDLSF